MKHARFNIPTFFRIILAILVLPLFSCQNFAPESDDSGCSGGAGISKDSDSSKKRHGFPFQSIIILQGRFFRQI